MWFPCFYGLISPPNFIHCSPLSCNLLWLPSFPWGVVENERKNRRSNNLGLSPENVFNPWNIWRMLLQVLYMQLGKTMIICVFSLNRKELYCSHKDYSDNISNSIHICIFTHELEALWSRIVCLPKYHNWETLGSKSQENSCVLPVSQDRCTNQTVQN